MRSFLNLMLALLAFVPMIFVASDTAQAQGVKMGFINDEKIKTAYPEWGRAQEQSRFQKDGIGRTDSGL
jgi:hypothetical protein